MYPCDYCGAIYPSPSAADTCCQEDRDGHERGYNSAKPTEHDSAILNTMSDQYPQQPATPPQYQPPVQQYAPQQQYQQPQYAQPQYMQLVKPPSNGLATASLVLGIITAVFFFSIIGWLFVPILGLLAIIFGTIGMSTAGKLDGLGKGKATAGLILGFSPIVLTVLFWIIGLFN